MRKRDDNFGLIENDGWNKTKKKKKKKCWILVVEMCARVCMFLCLYGFHKFLALAMTFHYSLPFIIIAIYSLFSFRSFYSFPFIHCQWAHRQRFSLFLKKERSWWSSIFIQFHEYKTPFFLLFSLFTSRFFTFLLLLLLLCDRFKYMLNGIHNIWLWTVRHVLFDQNWNVH